MVDFLKLAKGQSQNRGGEPLVTNSNVVGGSDLFKNFDQKMSEINLGGIDGNLRPANALENPSKVAAQPEYYVAALEKQDIQQTTNEIEISMDYMRQNEQYIQYKQRIKDLLRENDCDNVGELLDKHGDSRKVLDAMATLQRTFEADPKMKQHYQKTLTSFKQLNYRFNSMRGHINRGEWDGHGAVQNIATNEYNGNVAQAAKAYQSDMAELNNMRNNAISNINDTMIPFVDDHGKYVVDDLHADLKKDQASVQAAAVAAAKNDMNKPEPKPETTVESTPPTPEAREKKRENENSGPSL